jgi:hypothetical protein
LVVSDGTNTIFSAGYTGTGSNKIGSVQIGAFTVNQYGLIGEFKDIDDSNKTKYTGIRLRSDSGSNRVAFFAGGTNNVGSDAPFRVTNAGDIYASSGTIGGWTITSDHLYSSKGNKVYIGATADYTATTSSPIGRVNGAAINNLVFRFGTNANATFGVGSDGKMYATAGNIAGWTINTNGFTYSTIGAAGSFLLTPSGTYNSAAIAGGTGLTWAMTIGYTFGVTTGGALYATGANITGTVTASGGSIGVAETSGILKVNASIDVGGTVENTDDDGDESSTSESNKSITYFMKDNADNPLNISSLKWGVANNNFYLGSGGLVFRNGSELTRDTMYDGCRLTSSALVFTGTGGRTASYYGQNITRFNSSGIQFSACGYENLSSSKLGSFLNNSSPTYAPRANLYFIGVSNVGSSVSKYAHV